MFGVHRTILSAALLEAVVLLDRPKDRREDFDQRHSSLLHLPPPTVCLAGRPWNCAPPESPRLAWITRGGDDPAGKSLFSFVVVPFRPLDSRSRGNATTERRGASKEEVRGRESSLAKDTADKLRAWSRHRVSNSFWCNVSP